MQTAQQFQMFNRTGTAVSPATCIETLYFEQAYNGQVYRTSLNNRLLVTGNKLNTVTKTNISEALNRAELPFYYITKIKSDTASGLYRLDVSLYSINTAVKATPIINDLSTRIADNSANIHQRITDLSTLVESNKDWVDTNFLKLTGGKMSGGIVFGQKNSTTNSSLPGIVANGENLILSCPDNGYISLWGSISEEYGMNRPGIVINKPGVEQNGKVLVYNHSSSQMVWSMYNAGSLAYSDAEYNKYYILGITDKSYQEREFGETTFIATEANIENNVYVHKKNIYANAFYSSSDKELKTDIQDIQTDTYIPEIIQFKWLDTSEISYGVIAQDLEEHGLQCLMDKDDEDRWRVNYNATLSLITGDLQHKVKHLQNENILLKETINVLTERINKIESLLK